MKCLKIWKHKTLNFRHAWIEYSRCQKSERSVWKTEQNLVQISDVWISDIRAIPFVRLFQNPNFFVGFQTVSKLELFDNRTIFFCLFGFRRSTVVWFFGQLTLVF